MPVTIRLSARIAGLAIVAAEATAVATQAHESPTLVLGLSLSRSRLLPSGGPPIDGQRSC